ncbi:MAG TPA: DUF2723 domain-containing protein, partial [Chitinophagaceae bacterium]
MNFKRTNNLTGWIVCAIACVVYTMTREATASFWDCGEFISSAFKVQIPHPPGAPLFILLGRLFIVLFGGDAHTAALKVNLLSALGSGFTILFLFWSITHFARKLVVKNGEAINSEQMIAIMGAGVVGALAYAFSDSFWFSAVEGEVYGMSSFFTALVFWAILKWEQEAEQPYADRWIIFIAYMMGLSIGVHLLNLLTIPAIVMMYYFKRYKPARRGSILAFLIGCAITGIVQKFVISYIVLLAGRFDVFFVNTLRLPFNSGSWFFLALLTALIVLGIRWGIKKKHYFVYLGLLCFAFMLIGYSTYFTTMIRANASPSISMQDVSDPIALTGYLDRDQYGDFPLLYGQDFTARPIRYDKEAKKYEKNETTGRYDVVGQKVVPVYDRAEEHLFPRVWDASRDKELFYRQWLGLGPNDKPSFGDNLNWFLSYQVGWMYARYFMWNFAGRQNDLEGFGNVRDGNWISGIPLIDNAMLGDQSKLPDSLKENKARNKLYMLPLLLGLIGLVFQVNRNKKDFSVILLLFFFTGLAIVFYLNQAGSQPRERDYSFVGSFYAFAIWIGLGVVSLYNALRKKINGKIAAAGISLICLLAVPVLMGCQEWDDHDRSQKTLPRDVAADYLNSCAPNAILFTFGDNDTYPLWYAQEVEGVRPDIRIVNTSLLGVDWYIDELRRRVNEAGAVPMSWTPDKYVGDRRNFIPYVAAENIPKNQYFNLQEVMAFMAHDDYRYKIALQSGDSVNYLPTQNVFIPVNREVVIQNGTVPAKDSLMVDSTVTFTIPKTVLYKNDLLMLDIITANNWKRPIYFSSPGAGLGFNSYLQTDGLTYRLVPVSAPARDQSPFSTGNVNASFMYDTLMNKFLFGGAGKPGTYFDETNRRMLMSIRGAYARLGTTLAGEGKKDSALKVLNYSDKMINVKSFPYALVSNNSSNIHNITSMQLALAYYLAGDTKKGDEI